MGPPPEREAELLKRYPEPPRLPLPADPAQKAWAEKSKKRLAEIPWLQEKK